MEGKGRDYDSICKKIAEGTKKTEFMSSACIHRVPRELRKLKESAYTPRLVSIGPFHSKDDHILNSPMQDIKMSYVNSLLNRMTTGVSEMLKKCLDEMEELKEDAKKCYAEVVEELDEEMLVIDGCFILELLYRYYLNNSPTKENNQIRTSCDPVFSSIQMCANVQYDLLLLENQIPFFVLDKLFGLTVDCIPGHSLSLSDFVLLYFGNMMNFEGVVSTIPEKRLKDYYHILHLLHNSYLPDCDLTKEEEGSCESLHSASELDYAGVKFVTHSEQDIFNFKVNFSEAPGIFKWCCRARFEIPSLSIYDSTEPFLRNIIAFEQCCPGVLFYFTSYAVLMDGLIDSVKDVEVLEKAGVIRNHLGANEDASNLFNKLCKEIVLGKFYFSETCKNADKYSNRCWPAFIAQMRQKYFSTPWTFIAFCVAFILFSISVTQFLRSLLRGK